MVARKMLVCAAICCALAVISGALAGRASADERGPTIRSAIYRVDGSARQPVTVRPIQWIAYRPVFYGSAVYSSPYGPAVYYNPGGSIPGGTYFCPPAGMVAYGPYQGAWVGVYPPVTYPPSPGAYWAYGYADYPFGAFYGW